MTLILAQHLRRLAVCAAVAVPIGGCVGNPPPAEGAIWVGFAPPRAPAEERPRSPGRTYVWIAGYYRWTDTEYVWVPGHWEAPPRPRAHWKRGQWYRGNRGWYWVEGHWEGK